MSRPVCNHGGLSDSGYLASALQPRWSIDAELGSRFLANRLETGVRLITTAASMKTAMMRGSPTTTYSINIWELIINPNINDMRWQPVAVWDAYLRYKIGKNLTAELVGSNLTNRYYLDPMSRSYLPAPGRTIRIGDNWKMVMIN